MKRIFDWRGGISRNILVSYAYAYFRRCCHVHDERVQWARRRLRFSFRRNSPRRALSSARGAAFLPSAERVIAVKISERLRDITTFHPHGLGCLREIRTLLLFVVASSIVFLFLFYSRSFRTFGAFVTFGIRLYMSELLDADIGVKLS